MSLHKNFISITDSCISVQLRFGFQHLCLKLLPSGLHHLTDQVTIVKTCLNRIKQNLLVQ